MIDLNYSLIIQLSIVLGLMVILSHLGFKPFLKVLQARKDYLHGAERRAEELQRRVQELMQHYQEEMAAAQAKGAAIREEIRRESLAMEAQILQKTMAAANQMVREIKNRIAAETEIARARLGEEAQNLSKEIAQKILGRNLS